MLNCKLAATPRRHGQALHGRWLAGTGRPLLLIHRWRPTVFDTYPAELKVCRPAGVPSRAFMTRRSLEPGEADFPVHSLHHGSQSHLSRDVLNRHCGVLQRRLGQLPTPATRRPATTSCTATSPRLLWCIVTISLSFISPPTPRIIDAPSTSSSTSISCASRQLSGVFVFCTFPQHSSVQM